MGRAETYTSSGAIIDRGSVTYVRERPTGGTRAHEHVRYTCPEAVFRHEYVRLVQALALVAGDRDTATDAVQEAFESLVRGWDRVSGYEDPAGWVRRVALNKIREHQRSVFRRARLLLKLEQQPRPPLEQPASDPELWQQLRTLPARQRTAVALYYVGGLTAREVAEVMRVSEGAVDQHLHRALRTLRGTMEGQR